MAAVEPINVEFQSVTSIPKVTDCVGWDDHFVTGHGNSFIKLWKYNEATKKMDFVIRFRHLSDSEDVEVFNEDAEEEPAKKKSFQEPVTNLMLFHADAQEKPSNLLDVFDQNETNPVIQQLKDVLSAKTKGTTTFLCNFVGNELQMWNQKGEGMFTDLPVDVAAIVADEVFVEPAEGEGEICSESLLFGPPDTAAAINVTHTFGFFAAEQNRQLWVTTESGFTVLSRDESFQDTTSWDINQALEKKGITPGKFGWSYVTLCEWNQRVVVGGWEHGVHIWDPVKLGTLVSTLPEYNRGNPAGKVFTWLGYLCVSVSSKGNDRIDIWKGTDGQITKVGSAHLAGGNSDMEAKFFEWKGFLCALQYKTLTLYSCDSLERMKESKIEKKPLVYEKYRQKEDNNNNNNTKKKKKPTKKKRPSKQSNASNKKRKTGSVDKFDDDDEYQDEYEEEEGSEEEPEPEESEDEYHDEGEDSDD